MVGTSQSNASTSRPVQNYLFTTPDTDEMTGLPRREGFFAPQLTAWHQEVAANFDQSYPDGLLVIACDGDGFKNLNDTYGHERGNAFIREVADRLRRIVPMICGCVEENPGNCANHLIVRNGGDEFLILLRKVCIEVEVESRLTLLEFLFNRMDEFRIESEGQVSAVLDVTLSFGGVWSDGSRLDFRDEPTLMIDRADIAMRAAKRRRHEQLDGERFAIFTDEMYHEQLRLELRRGMYDEAVRYNRFRLVYMPIVKVDDASNQLQALEVLVRLDPPRNPDVSRLVPEEMEDFGVTSQLLVKVIPSVLERLTEWRENGLTLPLMFINVTPQMLLNSRINREIMALLRDPLYEPVVDRLVFEFTEATQLRPEPVVLERFSRLHDSGVATALDDFGVGYSNVSSLVPFHWSYVKVDKGFLLGLPAERASRVVGACGDIIRLLQPEATILFEGVEDQSHERLLRGMIRDHGLPVSTLGQGYYYGRAIPETELLASAFFETRRSVI